MWVSQSISRLQVTFWCNWGGYRKHCKIDFETGKCTFRWSKKMKDFQFFWDSQIFLGFYSFALLRLLKLTMNSKRPKSILWVSQSISRLRLTLWGNFGGYRKHFEIDSETGKCTFRWSKNENFSTFLRFPNFPWKLQICMASTFEAYDEF